MPTDHSGRFHDQHHTPEPLPIERTRKYGQDRPVRGSEPGAIDLSLQNVNLVAKSEDLSITPVTGYQEQPETSDQEPEQMRKDR